jgi:4-amino-4-deoxy-L-arabinose transferase-like glycosyltransferase
MTSDERRRDGLARVGYRALVALVFVAYALVCINGIADVWQWGPSGSSGSSFSLAAQNSIRFDTFRQYSDYMGAERPGAHVAVADGPPLLHLHLITIMGGVGETEWAARAVPALYSWLTLLLLFAIMRRYYGRGVALVGILAFAFAPMSLAFANAVTRDQGAIFWSVAFLYTYLRWFENRRVLTLGVALLAVSIAVQFDWPAYIIAIMAILHLFLAGTRHQTRVFQWQSEYTGALLLTAVVSANLVAFKAFGGVYTDELAAAAPTSEAFIGLLGYQLGNLVGPFQILLMGAWALVSAVRFARSKIHLGDILPLFFVTACVVRVLILPGDVDDPFWLFYLGPVACVAIATLGLGFAAWVCRALNAVLRGHAKRGVTAFGALLVLAILALHVQLGLDRLAWSSATGAAMVENYNDGHMNAIWIQDIATEFQRANTDFIVHNGLAGPLEWQVYLDAPFSTIERISLRRSTLVEGHHRVLLADLANFRNRERLSRLVRRHRTLVYDRRFLAIDLSTEQASFEAYAPVAAPASWLQRWLVHPRYADIQWEEDPDIDLVRALFSVDVDIVATERFGRSRAGNPIEWDCPKGLVLSGFDFTVSSSPGHIAEVQPHCRSLAHAASGAVTMGPREMTGPNFGSIDDGQRVRLECAPDAAVTGLYGRGDQLPVAVGLLCARPAEALDENASDPSTRSDVVGGHGGEEFEFECPRGSLAWGFRGSLSSGTQSIGVACAEIDEGFFLSWAADRATGSLEDPTEIRRPAEERDTSVRDGTGNPPPMLRVPSLVAPRLLPGR